MEKRKTQSTKHDYSKSYGKLIKIHQNKKKLKFVHKIMDDSSDFNLSPK